MRSHGKPDFSQTPIVRELRKAGVSVQLISSVGDGCPDIFVGWQGRTFGPYEIKMPGGKLTPDEATWWQDWRGSGRIIYCAEDVLIDIGAMAI
jgi:hypothetical protein